jgi:hypothetical protein
VIGAYSLGSGCTANMRHSPCSARKRAGRTVFRLRGSSLSPATFVMSVRGIPRLILYTSPSERAAIECGVTVIF